MCVCVCVCVCFPPLHKIRELFKRLRHVSTVGDRRALVELIVMTEVMHLFLDDPSEGNKRTALHYAAAEGKLMALKRLLKCGARVHAMDEEGNTPLHLAAAANQVLVPPLSLSIYLYLLYMSVLSSIDMCAKMES